MLKSTVVFLVIGFFLSPALANSASESAVLSFKEWKGQKIQLAQVEYKKLEEDYLKKKKDSPLDPKLKALYIDLKHSKESISELGDLSVTDYFIAYLSQFKTNRDTFQAALAKLAPDDISELMTAYANSLLKTSGEGIPAAAENQKNEQPKPY
ncbi:MAG: hypothetical protein ACK5V3_14015 [Bdellovibrionales bacterium]